MVFTHTHTVSSTSPIFIEATVLRQEETIAYMSGKLLIKDHKEKHDTVVAFGNHVKTFSEDKFLYKV